MADNLFVKLWAVSDILFALTLLVICFSQEKNEDEYTTSVRYRTVTIAIIIFFIAQCTIEMFYGPIHRAIIPKFKKVGWIMLIASVAVIATYIVVTRINFTLKADFTMEDVFNPIVRILPLFPYLSIFLICLSREEQDQVEPF